MKTASLGLLEVPVVRVNAGGDAPPDPPSVSDVTGHSPFLCFLQESFFANERENIFGGSTVRKYKPHQTNGGLGSTCMHVRSGQDTGDRTIS